jgi:GNAT superfamily N-acetyltransferase
LENTDEIIISTDKSLLDMDVIYQFLSHSYWAEGRPPEVIRRSVENSLCFGVYLDKKQIGFARVVTDYATFAWIADVFIIKEYRGKGYSKQLMKTILEFPELLKLKRWLLATRDAHKLYSRFGFGELNSPGRFMEIVNKQ